MIRPVDQPMAPRFGYRVSRTQPNLAGQPGAPQARFRPLIPAMAVAWPDGRPACFGLSRAAGADAAAGAHRVDARSVGAGVRAAARRALPGRSLEGAPGGELAGLARGGDLRARPWLCRDRHHVVGRRLPAGPVLCPVGADDPAAPGGAAVSRAGAAAHPDRKTTR